MRADTALVEFKLRLMAVVEAAPTVREGCRRAQIHPSTFYRWRRIVGSEGAEGLMPLDRRRRVGPLRRRLEAEVVAFALTHPGFGPVRVFDELRDRGIDVGSASQVWRILRSHGVNTTQKRHAVMGTARALETSQLVRDIPKRRIGRLEAETPGALIQMDCFHVGRLKGAKTRDGQGHVWQYTAIDVASSWVWAEVHTTRFQPSAVHTTALVHRVAQDLAQWGWDFVAVTTDNGNEFRDRRFIDACTELGVDHRFIRAGRPQTNGKVEQVHNTILRECWLPSFVGYRQPTATGAATDLIDYLTYYNHTRRHRGRWNQGKPPADIIIPNTGNMP